MLLSVGGPHLAEFLNDLNGVGKKVGKDLFDLALVADEVAKTLRHK